MADVIRGPWTGPQVQQPPWGDALKQHWCVRLETGKLLVRTDTGLFEAPVPPAELAKAILPAVRPHQSRITVALDARGMEGPEVDEALGVADAFDTVVDGWEDGSLVPSQDDVLRLARLTGFPPMFFYEGAVPDVGTIFICPGHRW